MIQGVASDLEPRRIETFDELYRYCYQVASVVGLTIIHIFGFDTPSALPLAEKCGVAFQLTNILRDIREDAERGRVYLPAEDLRRFGVTEDDLRAGNRTEAMLRAMRFEAARARRYYDESRPLLDLIHPRSKPSLLALISIYSRLLDRIERKNYDVFTRRVRLRRSRNRGSSCERWSDSGRARFATIAGSGASLHGCPYAVERSPYRQERRHPDTNAALRSRLHRRRTREGVQRRSLPPVFLGAQRKTAKCRCGALGEASPVEPTYPSVSPLRSSMPSFNPGA